MTDRTREPQSAAPKVTATQMGFLRLVREEQVVFMLGSGVRGLSKTSTFRRLDTHTNVTGAFKRLRAAGLVSTHGPSRGMSNLVVLTSLGRAALEAAEQRAST